MIVGKIQFGVLPRDALLERVRAVGGSAVELLREPVLVSALHGGPELDEDEVSAVKILFVAYVMSGRYQMHALTQELVGLVFGSLVPTVEEFDRWWRCDVYESEIDLDEVLAGLSDMNILKRLDPVIRALGSHQPSIHLDQLPDDSDD